MRPMPVPEPNDSATADLRLAFERMLPRRAEALARRGRLFCAEGWDINGLMLLHEDVQRLTGAAGTYGLLETSEALLRLEHVLGDLLGKERLPDADGSARIESLFIALGQAVPSPPPAASGARAAGPRAVAEVQPQRGEVPPAHFWRRWVDDAPPAVPVAARPDRAAARPAPTTVTAVATVAPGARAPLPHPPAPTQEAPRAAPAPAPEPLVPAVPAGLADDASLLAAARRVGGAAPITQLRPAPAALPSERLGRVYHLSDGGALACELDQKLEAAGYELEILDDPAELCEVLAALPPDLVVINSGFLDQLEGVGEALRESRRRTGARIPLLALAGVDSVQGRLSARRAGADAFLPGVANADEVVARVADLLSPEREEAYRILVVEDDRSQALFAESILRKAGMDVRVVCDAMEVIAAIEQFHPDLILMDLYMPTVDGAELTSLIREREADVATPIVFLSGEVDADKQLEALTAGGDDFLSKPIRPKHLIAAVSNRVRRARALLRQGASVAPDPRDPETGLHRRGFVIERINEALAEDDVRERDGGVLFLEVDGALALRERLGLSALEQLMAEVARRLAQELREFDLAARYGEGSFFVLAPARGESDLEALAQVLRNALAAHDFRAEGRPLRLRVMVGVCPLRFGFADAGAVLNTAERSCREARRSAHGVHLFSPARAAGEEAQTALLERLRHAIERDAFDLLYQPIVPLQGGEEAQYQTLVRLRDELGRVYTAAEIVPLASSAGLIVDVDRWVLSRALAIAARRQREQRPVRLFVSQSAQSLCTADQAEWIIAQLAAHGVSGDRIAIELPLSELDDCQSAIERFCRGLLPAGVHLCLSQYESGTLGDSLLEQLPIDFLKLAPRYLAAAQAQVVRDELMLTIERAHRRNISVIAHRVEDAQSATTLWIVGIDYIQGNMVQQAGDGLDFDFQTAVL